MIEITDVIEPFRGRGPLRVTNLRFAMCKKHLPQQQLKKIHLFFPYSVRREKLA